MEEAPEETKCPVCFEIPPKEIYQCKNGHLVCRSCSTSLTLCPQCRVPYEAPKIRSRGVENLLNLMKFNCPNKKEGCSKQLSRKELLNHSQNCSYGSEKLNLCELLNLSCKFLLNTRNLAAAFEHMRSNHKMKVCIFKRAKIRYKNFCSVQTIENFFWTPVIFRTSTLPDNSTADNFILLSFYNTDDSSITFAVLNIRKKQSKDDVYAKFIIKSVNSEQARDIVWLAPTVFMSDAAKELKQSSLRLPLAHLKKYTAGGILDLNCVIGDSNDSIPAESPGVQTAVINVSVLSSNEVEVAPDAQLLRVGAHSSSCVQANIDSLLHQLRNLN